MKKKNVKQAVLYRTRLRRGDKVQVITGKSKGHIGNILKVDRKNGVFFIEGANVQKKHVKPNQKNQRGGIIEKEGPINFSNVLLFSEKHGKGKRFHIESNGEGKKERIFE